MTTGDQTRAPTPPRHERHRLRRGHPPGRPRGQRGAALTALASGMLVLAACGGTHSAPRAAPTTVAPSTVAPSTSTTTRPKPRPRPPAPATAPLTGLFQPSRSQLAAPAVVVKIDNVDAARPQSGVNQADVVYEEEVEGGLTRLAAVFQSQYPAVVGPVRSGRLTDEGIADDLNHPVFAYSGTNAIFLPILRAQPVTDVDGDNHPGLFYRSSLNVSPHNLYASVASLAAASTTHSPPPALFHFVAAGHVFTGPGVTPAAGIDVSFPTLNVGWNWNPAVRQWQRSQNGTADVDRSGSAAERDECGRPVRSLHQLRRGDRRGRGPGADPGGVARRERLGVVPQRWQGASGVVDEERVDVVRRSSRTPPVIPFS